MRKNSVWAGATGALVVGLSAGGAMADQVSFAFSGSIASGHSAAATFTFDDVAHTAVIRIENTIDSAHNSLGSRALTGLFWNMSPGSLPFTGVSATAGTPVNNPGGFDPTQLWAFRGDLSAGSTPFGTQFGLGAAGFDVFSGANMLAPGGPQPQPNGIDGGILSQTGDAYGGQNQNPMWRSFVELTFNVPSSFFAGGIGNIAVSDVGWQFGSEFNEPGITVVPLPAGVWAGAAGILGVAGWQGLRRRRLAS